VTSVLYEPSYTAYLAREALSTNLKTELSDINDALEAASFGFELAEPLSIEIETAGGSGRVGLKAMPAVRVFPAGARFALDGNLDHGENEVALYVVVYLASDEEDAGKSLNAVEVLTLKSGWYAGAVRRVLCSLGKGFIGVDCVETCIPGNMQIEPHAASDGGKTPVATAVVMAFDVGQEGTNDG
jgi:hypothetical protein